MKIGSKEEAELLSHVIDLLNEGKAREANKLIRDSEAHAGHIVSLVRVHKMYANLPPVPDEQMERSFARIRRECDRRFFEHVVEGRYELCDLQLDIERRTDFLILFLHLVGPMQDPVKLAKLLFLFWKEGEYTQEQHAFYNDYAYDFGVFDKDVPQDLKALKKLGLLEKKADGLYKLTPKGEAVAKQLVENGQQECRRTFKDVRSIVEKYGGMSAEELLAYTDKKYPDYAGKSKIRDQYPG